MSSAEPNLLSLPRRPSETSVEPKSSTTHVHDRGFDVPLAHDQQWPTAFVCLLCKLLLREPFQAACGDRFCKVCIERLLSENDNAKCPVDGTPLDTSNMFKDVFAEREILSLQVACPAKHCNQKCGWTGTLRDYQDHTRVCLYAEVPCPNINCKERPARCQLQEHLTHQCVARCISCHHCNEKLPAGKLQGHESVCPMYKVPCPNGCSPTAMERRLIGEHRRTNCPLEQVLCFYHQIGCQFVGHRRDLPDHHSTDMANHLQLSFLAFQASQSKVAQVQNSHDTLAEKYAKLESKVDELSGLVQRLTTAVPPPLSIPHCNCPLGQNGGSRPGSEVSYERMEMLEPSQLSMGVTPSRVDRQLCSMERTLALHDVQLSELAIRQDLAETKQTSGVLLWKLGDYTRRYRDAVSGKTPSLYSPPFYTSPCGYKLCARIYPNGDGIGRGNHLSLFLVVMQGEFDALLQWPFPFKVSLMLLDQNKSSPRHVVETFRPDPSSSSFQRPQGEMNVASGCPLFLPHSSLPGKYLVDDTIFVKIIIHNSGSAGPDAP